MKHNQNLSFEIEIRSVVSMCVQKCLKRRGIKLKLIAWRKFAWTNWLFADFRNY